ncbi:MAG TPA: glycine cleavage system protein GcvH [Planctomycetota bacterium]|nr:glycine cleavage system protein GcvH [Planctomycetota bacterium]
MKRPDKARYSKSHEWAILEGDVLTLGVTDWAVEHLGDLVYVDLPDAGKQLAAGDTACEIESVKAVGEVYSPVAGKVTAVNSGLADDPAPLAGDPYGKGWLVKIKVTDPSGYKKLLDLAAYEKHLETADAG